MDNDVIMNYEESQEVMNPIEDCTDLTTTSTSDNNGLTAGQTALMIAGAGAIIAGAVVLIKKGIDLGKRIIARRKKRKLEESEIIEVDAEDDSEN